MMPNFKRPLTRRCCVVLFSWTLAAMLGQSAFAQAPLTADGQPTSERQVLGLEYQGAIRAVFQITGNEESQGVNKGLLSLRELHRAYREHAVAPDTLELRAVVHGPASTALLTDQAWSVVTGKPGPNPNTALLMELADLGVTVDFVTFVVFGKVGQNLTFIPRCYSSQAPIPASSTCSYKDTPTFGSDRGRRTRPCASLAAGSTEGTEQGGIQ